MVAGEESSLPVTDCPPIRTLSIVARAVSPTRAATSTRFAAAAIVNPIADARSISRENSSVWTELFARDNGAPRSKNANDAHRRHGGSDGRLLGRALESQQSRPVQEVHRAGIRHPAKVRRQDPRARRQIQD